MTAVTKTEHHGTAVDEADDPLAGRAGIYAGADDLPCGGWPETVDDEVLEKILSWLPEA